MISFDVLAALLFGGGAVLIIVIGMRRMGWLGDTNRRASSGFASGLAGINEMLQPQMPTAEQIERLREEGEDEEDDGQGGPPRPPAAKR